MMDFARRLAPSRLADPGRAVAVLPSRFAASEWGPAGPATAIEGQAPGGAEAAPRPGPDGRSAPGDRPAFASHPGPAPSWRRDGMPQPETPRAAHRHDEATPLRQVAAHAFSPPAPASMRPATASGAPAAPDAATGATPVDPASVKLGSLHAQTPAWPPRPAHAAHPPLSDAALAERATPASAPRPIVHVSIDRIEVRAPAAPARPAPAPRARATAPGVSLGDYLRQRQPGGSS